MQLIIRGLATFFLAVSALPVSTKPVFAQTPDYTITWQADNLIVARLKNPVYADNLALCTNWRLDPYGHPNDSEVAIGVSRWTVKGTMASGKFKEIWTTPQLPRAFTYTGDFINNRCTNGRLHIDGLAAPNDWLAGWLTVTNLGRSAMEIRTVGVNDSIGHHNLDDSVSSLGNATSCQVDGGDTSRCTYATGAYGWTTLHKFQSGGDKKHMNIGTLIPLHWRVSGTVCDPGDNRCD